ncbi:MAG: helix-turn-helix transcriptional regulator [Kofleriaceae bacterium]
MWLRAGRAQRKLTLNDVARVTKIQPRILEKIEAGNLEGLPAEVFVRGFVKSFARCVGLDVGEAIERYGQCANAPVLPTNSVARAFVETLVAAPKAEKTPQGAPTPPEVLPSASMELMPIAEHPDVEIEIATGPKTAPAVAVTAPAVTAPAVTAAPAPAPGIEVEVREVVAELIDAAQLDAPKKKRSRKKAAGTAAPRTRKSKSAATGTGPSPLVVELAASLEAAIEAPSLATASPDPTSDVRDEVGADATMLEAAPIALAPEGELESAADALFAPSDGIIVEHELVEDDAALADGSTPVVADPWQPTMPPVVASVPWKRPTSAFKLATTFTLPSLVIDDADPDNAEREREDREISKGPHRVAFLPPILLDREDKSGRQGGLTLAVILLLIAATLTLSYLMRRPSVSGDGVTQSHVDTTEIVA